MTFKIGAKSSAANLLKVAESFDRFFEDPGLVVMTTNVLLTVDPMFYFSTRAIMGLLFPKCASAIFAHKSSYIIVRNAGNSMVTA